jgi:hypothetical protein
MSSRWYNTAVLLFWLVSMGWLLAEKVLPPMVVGDPPNYGKILAEEQQAPEPVSWQLYWQERAVGWSHSETEHAPGDVTKLRNHVHLERFPLQDLAPPWLAPVLEGVLGPDGHLDVDAHSTVELMPIGSRGDYRLYGLSSTVQLGPLEDVIRLQGLVHGNQLDLSVRCGDFVYRTSTDVAHDALVGDGLSPRTRLPELHVGQTWTEPVYSPLQMPNSPAHILKATVERQETIPWDGEAVRTWLVVYRNDPGSELTGSKMPRGRAWVHADGRVLKQEVVLLSSTLLFVRLPPGEVPAESPRREAP